jgi:hypothetical protein
MKFSIEDSTIHAYFPYHMCCVLMLDCSCIYRWRQNPIEGLIFEIAPRHIKIGDDYATY